MTFNIIKYSNIWLGISAALILASVAAVAIFGLKFGIDFTGGSLMEIHEPTATVEELRIAVEKAGFEAAVQPGEGDAFFIRLPAISEADHQKVLAEVKDAYPNVNETRFDAVGPTVGDELKRASAKAVLLLLVLIGAYIAWAFRTVSHPVASWKYGLVTAIAALHDVIIPLGAFAIAGHFLGYQVDTAFVAAMLTILGYSINDTIVVFDRTRENLFRHRHGNQSFADTVNISVMETMARSVNTTLTTLLPLIAIFIVGGETTRPFVFALIVGILSGAYSSIFVASPLLVLMERVSRKK